MTTVSAALRRSRELTLAAVPTAASCSRAFARDTLRRWRLDGLIDTAELVTSELVTNSVRTAGTTDGSLRRAVTGCVHCVQVRLALTETSLFVEVRDRDGNAPVLVEPDAYAENGRGIFIVDSVCKNWGYFHPENGGKGKTVWCELELPDASLLEKVLARLRQLPAGDPIAAGNFSRRPAFLPVARRPHAKTT